MKRDFRVHLDPTTRPHHQKIEADLLVLDTSVVASAWGAMVPPLVRLVVAVTNDAQPLLPAFPATGDPRFQLAFEALARELTGRTDRAQRDAQIDLLARRVARAAAHLVPPQPDAWVRAAALFHDWHAWREFLAAVPVAAIERRVFDLMRMPTDEAAWLDSFGALREDRGGVLRDLDEQFATATDVGAWLLRVEQYADHAVLGAELRARSELLARVGAVAWLTWAANLPHAVYAALAANDVYDLDFVEAVIAAAPGVSATARARLVATLLVANRAVELFEQVDRQLTLAASMRWSYLPNEAARTEYEAWLTDWRGIELPGRISRIATTLAAPGEASAAAINVTRRLRSLSSQYSQTGADIRATLRERLLGELATRDADARISALFHEPIDSTALLAGTHLVLRAPSPPRTRAALTAYRDWCNAESFFWSAPLDVHDDAVIEALARCLAAVASPVDEATALIDSVEPRSQGWGFDLRQWFPAVPKVTHVVIVTAVAAGFSHAAGRQPEASALIEIARGRLERWLRDAPTRFDDAHTQLALGYVLAFVGKILGAGAGPSVASMLASLDELRDIITAAENYAANLAPAGVPLDVQRVLRNAFEVRLPVVASHPHVTAAALAEIGNTVRRLACDAYAEVAPPPTDES